MRHGMREEEEMDGSEFSMVLLPLLIKLSVFNYGNSTLTTFIFITFKRSLF